MSWEKGGTSRLIDLSLGGVSSTTPSTPQKSTETRQTGLSPSTVNYLKSLRQSSARLRSAASSQTTLNAAPLQPSTAPQSTTIRLSSAIPSVIPPPTRKINPTVTPLSSVRSAKSTAKQGGNKTAIIRKRSISSSESSLSSIVHVIRSLDELGISSEDEQYGVHDAIDETLPESDQQTGQKSTGFTVKADPRLPSADSNSLKVAVERSEQRNEDIFRAKSNRAVDSYPAAVVYDSDFDDKSGSSVTTEVGNTAKNDDVESSIPEEPISSSSTSTQTEQSADESDSSSTSSTTDDDSGTSTSSTTIVSRQYSSSRDERNLNNRSSRASQTAVSELESRARKYVLPPSAMRQLTLQFAEDARRLNGPLNTALLSILEAQIAFIRIQADHQWEALNRWNTLMEQQLGDFTSSAALQAKLNQLNDSIHTERP